MTQNQILIIWVKLYVFIGNSPLALRTHVCHVVIYANFSSDIIPSFFFLLLFFFFYFTILYWFYHHTLTWIRHGVHVFPIRNPPPTSPQHHPSGSSQYTSPKHLAPCIEPRLAIRFLYDIIHVSMPFSQIIPLSPSPTESKSPLYTSVSLLLSCIQGYHYHLSKLYWCFSFWLTSLCLIGSSFIHLIRTDSNVFFLIAE